MEQGQIIKGYRNDDALRGSFDRLAQRTFDLAFEDWYQNGFWGDDYIPYSVVIDGAVPEPWADPPPDGGDRPGFCGAGGRRLPVR